MIAIVPTPALHIALSRNIIIKLHLFSTLFIQQPTNIPLEKLNTASTRQNIPYVRENNDHPEAGYKTKYTPNIINKIPRITNIIQYGLNLKPIVPTSP
jgi:hypothetical protein